MLYPFRCIMLQQLFRADTRHNYTCSPCLYPIQLPLTPPSLPQVVFLPVVPWRHEPEPERRPQGQASGLSGFIRGRIAQAVDEASDLWAGMQAADEGTLKHRIFKLVSRGVLAVGLLGIVLALRHPGSLWACIGLNCTAALDAAVPIFQCMPHVENHAHPQLQGQRMLDGISAEERLMRALPKKVSRVLIFHPSHVR